MEEKKKQFRVYIDYSHREYSKPIEADSLKEVMDRFREQGYYMYDDLAYDEEADWDSEEICCDLGAKEYYWDEKYEEWEEEDSMNRREYDVLRGWEESRVYIREDEYNELRRLADLARKYADVIAKLEAEEPQSGSADFKKS